MIEYLISLLIEQYGPIALLGLFLWRRQTALTQSVIRLAEETPGVDEDRVSDSVQPLSLVHKRK